MSWAKTNVFAGILHVVMIHLGLGGTRISAHAGPPPLGFLIVLSLLIDLGLETDATEDDFGVWEVKTMVAIILHLLEGPSGKVPLTTCHLLSGQGECLPINPPSPPLH